MFVEMTKPEDGSVEIIIFGESLKRDEGGIFLLPGRLISGLKTEDLPEEIKFRLSDQLKTGLQFYKEDTVVFVRFPMKQGLFVQVTTSYKIDQWDGIFDVTETLKARRVVIDKSHEYCLEQYEKKDMEQKISFSFHYQDHNQNDLESAIGFICQKVNWVEEKGNEQLLCNSLWRWKS